MVFVWAVVAFTYTLFFRKVRVHDAKRMKKKRNVRKHEKVRSSLMSSAEQRRVARIGLSVDVLSVGGVRVCDVCR